MENPGGRNVDDERPAEPVKKPVVAIAERNKGGVVEVTIISSSKEVTEARAEQYREQDYPWAGYATVFSAAHKIYDGSWVINGSRNSKC